MRTLLRLTLFSGLFFFVLTHAGDLEKNISYSGSDLHIVDAARVVLEKVSKENKYEVEFRPSSVELAFYSDSMKIEGFRAIFDEHIGRLCTYAETNISLRDIPASKVLSFLAEQADCTIQIEEEKVSFTRRPQKRFIASIQTQTPEELMEEGLNRLYESGVDYYGPLRYSDSLSYFYYEGILHFIAEEWAFDTLMKAHKETERKGAIKAE